MSSRPNVPKGANAEAESDYRASALDLLRISQKTPYTERRRCTKGAPYIAVVKNGEGSFGQGCCKSWDCPRCSQIYAAYHHHRMVEGAKLLLETGPLYFWTITCRGKDLDLETSDDDYLLWTNRLLSACRYHAKKSGARWAYVQVTERQKRGAAHSHFLHTWVPSDSQYRRNGKGHVDVTSDYFIRANVKAGLGPQCKISQVSSAVGVSSYVAKYLKKHLSDTVWPSNWRRIRYSQDFPDTTEQPDYAIALTSNDAWARLETYAVANRQHFIAADRVAYEIGRRRIVGIEPPVMLETVG